MRLEDLEAAIDHRSESESVDYKVSFDPSQTSEWLELIKDVVAFANSGGGVIVVGMGDGGDVVGCDSVALERIDPAELTDKVHKYTGHQLKGFRFTTAEVEGKQLFAILVSGVPVPLVFSKPGTYDIGNGRQKTAFSAGTVYFRHGAKSEPGNSEDLRWCFERRLEETRKLWFEGIAKVVEAPAGSRVEIVTQTHLDAAGPVRLVNDPSAPALRQVSIDETHPYRQKEVVEECNKALHGKKTINPHHVQCVRVAHSIDENPTFCCKLKYTSPRYSKAFVEWILEQQNADPNFFDTAKVSAEAARRTSAANVTN